MRYYHLAIWQRISVSLQAYSGNLGGKELSCLIWDPRYHSPVKYDNNVFSKHFTQYLTKDVEEPCFEKQMVSYVTAYIVFRFLSNYHD